MSERRVLELRIHGVNNTAPWSMLELSQDAVHQVEGDTLGSFWQPTDDGQAGLKPDDPGRVPSGIVREAYSWGGMARSSSDPLPLGANKYAAAAARFGWTLLMPFSLLNMAYWSRRLVKEEPAGEGMAPQRIVREGWRGAGGGAQLRVAGLLLTLLLTLPLCVIALDLVSVQCYQDSTAPCSNLPSFVDFLSSWDVARRLALMSFAPLVAFCFLYGLTLASATRYTASSSSARSWQRGHYMDASETEPVWPMLRTRGFWNPLKLLQRTALLHLSAVAMLIALLTSWNTTYGDGTGCSEPAQLLRGSCWHQVDRGGARAWTEFAILVLTLAVLAAIACALAVGTEDAPDVRRPATKKTKAQARSYGDWTTVVGAVAVAVFAAQELILVIWPAPRHDLDTRHPLLGIAAMPAVLIAVLLAVAVAGSTWRMVENRWPLAIALLFAAAALMSSFSWHHGDVAWVFRGVALLALGWCVSIVLSAHGGPYSPRRRYTAWSGCAPGVFVMLALLFAMVLSSGVVVAVGDVLNGTNSAGSLAGGHAAATAAHRVARAVPACAAKKNCPADLQVPRPYVWFGAALLTLVVLMVVVLVVVLVRARRRPDDDPRMAGHDLSDYPAIHGSVVSKRWFASLMHRAEKHAGALALIGFAVTTAEVLLSVSGWRPSKSSGADAFAGWVLGSGMWVLGATGVLIIGLAAGGKAVGNARPLGLLWDLTCFLPKAAHPFGPPCYAERVVPELLARYEEWLTVDGESPAPGAIPPARTIVLSAHSLGSVLAVASVFALLPAPPEDDSGVAEVGAISLLTYGSQLRGYFGRILPDLLGPDVLGHLPSRAADLFAREEMTTSIEDEDDLPDTPPADSLRALLGGKPGTGGRWISLWHRTDYIGFPVVRYRNSPVDRYAEEVDDTGYMLKVLTHSDYPRTPAYAQALRDLTTASS
ncbi:MAG TPA: hypothetical protein VKQ07_07240 [Jatrophihabitantaceae bacterium]|nr:hypothetical protein [Jatrophihabitantaceae bacterium]